LGNGGVNGNERFERLKVVETRKYIFIFSGGKALMLLTEQTCGSKMPDDSECGCSKIIHTGESLDNRKKHEG
jgi:hypothetical protein